jgi:hypothetical protein
MDTETDCGAHSSRLTPDLAPTPRSEQIPMVTHFHWQCQEGGTSHQDILLHIRFRLETRYFLDYLRYNAFEERWPPQSIPHPPQQEPKTIHGQKQPQS